MYKSKKSANEKFYEAQRRDFERRDRECHTRYTTRADHERMDGYYRYHDIKIIDTPYGLSRGSRGVLLSCKKWISDCWLMFIEEGNSK